MENPTKQCDNLGILPRTFGINYSRKPKIKKNKIFKQAKKIK